MALGRALTLTAGLLLQMEAVDQDDARYLRLLNLYRSGGGEEAIRQLGALDAAVLKRVMGRLAPGMDDVDLRASSLLETELAMSLAERSRWEEADVHFNEAWKTSLLIDSTTDRLSFQRDWLLAAGLFHHQLIFVHLAEEAFTRADRFLQDAVRRYPRDPQVLLAAGSLLDWSGSLRWGERSHLKQAEELYARARRLAPADAEILLRHGWVLEKLGKDEEASAALLRVLELEAGDDILYRSRMVLGRLAERDGRAAEAIAHYEAAREAIPSWQVAHVALAHALHRSGSHERAREILASALSMDRRSADEALGGWWSYELGIALRFEPLFERMRAEVME